MSSTTAKVICCSRQEGPSKVQSERVRSSHRQTNGGQQAACDKDAESASAVVGDGRHLWFRSRVSGPPSRPLLPPLRARPSTRMARNSKNLMPVSSGFMSCRCIKIGGINRLRRGQSGDRKRTLERLHSFCFRVRPGRHRQMEIRERPCQQQSQWTIISRIISFSSRSNSKKSEEREGTIVT